MRARILGWWGRTTLLRDRTFRHPVLQVFFACVPIPVSIMAISAVADFQQWRNAEGWCKLIAAASLWTLLIAASYYRDGQRAGFQDAVRTMTKKVED